MHRLVLKSSRTAGGPRSAFAVFMAGGFALAALIGTGCEGTSSGVDNPGLSELTVSFRDAAGAAVRVTGDLDVYAKDQNPAVQPEPMATVRIRNSALTNLTSEDFERINTAGKTAAAIKRSAASPGIAPPDTPIAFNLVFRSDARTGSLTFGLVYDPKTGTFARGGAGLARLDIQPKELIRYEAQLKRLAAVHGDLGRVYIPGTPYQATLADSGFVFEALPSGVFDLRLLGGDGRIFAVKESLDTRTPLVFTPDSVAVGKIDTTDTLNRPVRFTVATGGPAEAFVGVVTVLEGKIVGVDTTDKRASILWRILRELSPDSLGIVNPFSLRTQARFRRPGIYSVELSVTIGAVVARDTLVVPVREAPAPAKPSIIFPKPNDSLFAGVQYKLSWEMPVPGPVSIQLSTMAGREGTWHVLADSARSAPGISYFVWTPPDSLAHSTACAIRVKLLVADSLVAQMPGTFSIVPRLPITKDPIK